MRACMGAWRHPAPRRVQCEFSRWENAPNRFGLLAFGKFHWRTAFYFTIIAIINETRMKTAPKLKSSYTIRYFWNVLLIAQASEWCVRSQRRRNGSRMQAASETMEWRRNRERNSHPQSDISDKNIYPRERERDESEFFPKLTVTRALREQFKTKKRTFLFNQVISLLALGFRSPYLRRLRLSERN